MNTYFKNTSPIGEVLNIEVIKQLIGHNLFNCLYLLISLKRVTSLNIQIHKSH
jgi:hypothetical protein